MFHVYKINLILYYNVIKCILYIAFYKDLTYVIHCILLNIFEFWVDLVV